MKLNDVHCKFIGGKLRMIERELRVFDLFISDTPYPNKFIKLEILHALRIECYLKSTKEFKNEDV